MTQLVNEPQDPTGRTWRAKLKRCFKLAGKSFLGLVAVYLLILLIGLIPVNSDFEPTPGGVKIYLTSNAVHAELVLPLVNECCDWSEQFPQDCFFGDIEDANLVAIGWGDRGFFINTPTWGDIKFSTAANALLWPSRTCIHVDMTRVDWLPEDVRSVEISKAEYLKLVAFVQSKFRMEDGKIVQIPAARYSESDAFFESHGRYHLLNTCNSWVGNAMKATGIKTPWMSTLPKSPYLYLPE